MVLYTINRMSDGGKKDTCDNIHYLGIALIVVSLLLLLCWLGKSNKYEGFKGVGPRLTPIYGYAPSIYRKHVSDETRPTVVVEDDVVKRAAVGAVRIKWASDMSTGSHHQGFEVMPDSELDPNAGATIVPVDNAPNSTPPSVPLGDAIATPGLGGMNSSCSSLTSTLLNLTDNNLDNGMAYYGAVNNSRYLTI